MNVAAQKPAETGTLAASYRAYQAPVEKGAEEAGEDWAEGPVRFLLTAEQKMDYERLSDPASRSEYITEFWKGRDPKSETPENEARIEFERRVAFADSRFSQDETRGSLTDRGMVFVLLGPPTWAGRKPINTGDDVNDPKGMSMYSDLDVRNALRGASSAASARIYDRMTSTGTKLHERRRQLSRGLALPPRAASGGNLLPAGGLRLHHAPGLRRERLEPRAAHAEHAREGAHCGALRERLREPRLAE